MEIETKLTEKEENYWELRDRIVKEFDTEDTIRIVIDLMGNLIDLEEEVCKDNPKLKEDYEELRLNLGLLKIWN